MPFVMPRPRVVAHYGIAPESSGYEPKMLLLHQCATKKLPTDKPGELIIFCFYPCKPFYVLLLTNKKSNRTNKPDCRQYPNSK